MKATLEFDFDEYEDKQDLKLMLKAQDLKFAIDEIWNRLFRPLFKHGYQESELNEMMKIHDEDDSEAAKNARDVVDKLGEIYIEILKEYDLQDLD